MKTDFPNLRHLRAFRGVAEQKGVSAASGQVNLSQPAITQAIAGLETALGLPLFDRRSEGMFPTDAGRIFLNRVQRLLDHLRDGARSAVRIDGRRGGRPGAGFQTHVTASQLRALVAIWETGNFSLAARAIGISQPSVHRAARDLEKLSGIAFFAATRNGIALTPAGEVFARHVKLAAAELRQGRDEITRLNGRDSTVIRIGSMPLSRSQILPHAMHELLAESAEVQLRAVDGPYTELLRGLRHGDLDFLIGALRDPAPTADVVQEPLLRDPLAIVTGPGHPLAGRSGVSLEDTLSYPWIAPPKTTPAGSYLYRKLDIENRARTPVRIVSSSLVLVRGLLARGNYVTIMSLHQMALEQSLGLMVPLAVALPGSTRPIGLTFRRGWSPTPTQARFLDLIRQAARQSENHVSA